jgi:hypothetical protein
MRRRKRRSSVFSGCNSVNWRFSVSYRGVSPCWRAYFLLLRQKKVAKEKATPGSAPRYARSLALLGRPGGSPELACGSDKASRLPPASLRCSAPLKGARKASRVHAMSEESNTAVAQKKCRKPELRLAPGRFTGPLERCRATQGLAEKGRGLSEGQRPEFRSPRQSRVAQGTRVAGTDPGSPSFCLLFLGEARKSKARRKRETHR